MRISGGEFGGRVLRTPKGEATRPTSGMVRECLFNILAPRLADAVLLDLYAGCGSVGLEALSRGASSATFVEKARPALDCLRGNIATLAVEEATVVLPISVESALTQLSRHGERYDIIFLDPPFADVPAYHAVLSQVAPLLTAEGVVIAQHYSRVKLLDDFAPLQRYRKRDVGDNTLSFYRIDLLPAISAGQV